jgi:hypothetical protein
MTFFKRTFPLILGFMLMAGAVFGQKQKTDTAKKVSEKELHEFGRAYSDMQQINLKFRQKANKVFKKSGLSPKRYLAIKKSKANPKAADTLNITKKEQKEYKKVDSKVRATQQKMVTSLKSDVKKRGLTWNRFQEIAMEMRTDKNLRQRYQKMKLKEMKSDTTGHS